MNVFFDTSVLVAAVVDQLPNHLVALDCYRQYSSGDHVGYCSTHALAECYATLTALPLPRRVSAAEACTLVEHNLLSRLRVISLADNDYLDALRITAAQGLLSGQIYDALHVAAARKARCGRIYTYNLRHFQALCPKDIDVSSP